MNLRGKSVVWWIIAICVVFFVFEFILLSLNPDSINYFALNANNLLSGKYVWTLVTHMFAHGGVFHLFINMFALFSFGNLCEKIIGKKRFIWFYLISGIFAGILSVLLSGFFGYGFWENVFGSPEVYMIGASGEILAVA